MRPYQISVCGDSAINIVVADTISVEASALVRSAPRAFKQRALQASKTSFPRFVPSWSHTTPKSFPMRNWFRPVHANLDGLSAEGASADKTIVIPVCYGGEFGPDLEHVAQFHGITPDEVVRLHTEPTYLIAMLGFLPGFAYLSGLNPDLETPRLEVPRVRIEAGAVGIGGAQTGIYPLPSPGGWQIIAAARCAPTTQNASRRFCMPRAISLNSRPFPPMNMRKSRPRCRLEPTNTA